MPYQNLSISFPNANRDLALLKADEIKALMPFLVNLALAEKRKGRKLGNKSEKFFIDVLFLMQAHPQMSPQFVSALEFEKDIDTFLDLLAVELKLSSLLESVADTRMALAQEMMPAGLALYANVKQAARANVPGSDSALEKLKPYFEVKRKKKK